MVRYGGPLAFDLFASLSLGFVFRQGVGNGVVGIGELFHLERTNSRPPEGASYVSNRPCAPFDLFPINNLANPFNGDARHNALYNVKTCGFCTQRGLIWFCVMIFRASLANGIVNFLFVKRKQ